VKVVGGVLLAAAITALAPFQCASDPDPNKRREDTPGDAHYGLSQDFAKSGDKAAQVRTLKYIVERYPRSHFAATARDDLRELGETVPDTKNTEEGPEYAPPLASASASTKAP
jgi:hypothetical protein